MTVDYPDWTLAVEEVTGSTVADYPDFTTAVEVVGGGGGGSIPDPFDITVTGVSMQVPASGFANNNTIAINDTDPGIELFSDDLIYIHSSESPVQIAAANASVTLTADTTGIGHISLDASFVDIAFTSGSKIGFFNPAGGPAGKQTVTGSRGGNAALASLLTALANLGLITNSTTA